MNKPKIDELRRELRDAISRKARLNYDGAWVPCLIQDMSSQGFGIICGRPFFVGQVVELRCDPYPGKEFQCKVEIRHISESYIGVLIREISEAGHRLCMQLMQDYHSDRISIPWRLPGDPLSTSRTHLGQSRFPRYATATAK